MSDEALRRLWAVGQAQHVPEATREAIGAARDEDVERALDVLARHRSAADLVRAVSALRGDADQLARAVKSVRQPVSPRSTRDIRARWATAAAVLVLASWFALPGSAPVQSPGPAAPATSAAAPLAGSNPPGDRERIVSASFEGDEGASVQPAGHQPHGIFGAGFDS